MTVHPAEFIGFPNADIKRILGFKPWALDKHLLNSHWIPPPSLDGPPENYDGLLISDYPVDVMAGKHYMSVYINIIEYQFVSDTKAPLLRTITLRNRLKNGCLNHNSSIQHDVFHDSHYKKLLASNISAVSIELRTETGEYVPFTGVGTVSLTLTFKRVK